MKNSKHSKKRSKKAKNGGKLKNNSLNNISWSARMEITHAKALGLFKNILTSNGYLSFEAAFVDIKKSYGLFEQFLNDQGVKFSSTIKTSKDSMESALEIGLKNIEIRLKIA